MSKIIGLILAVLALFVIARYFSGNSEDAEKTLEIGKQYLENNKNLVDVITTSSGLQYQILEKSSSDKKPSGSDTVKVHYHGTLIDGEVFDSSVNRGQPIEFGLHQVIKGWTEGLQLMAVGDKFRLFIPPSLGYGKRASGKIPANSVLIFDVELIAIN